VDGPCPRSDRPYAGIEIFARLKRVGLWILRTQNVGAQCAERHNPTKRCRV
jgi:hypothetical protein